MDDIVAKLPDEIAKIEQTTGVIPNSVKIEEGYICIWDNRYFIHARATLPLISHDDGVGFGLWVEVGEEVFETYMKTADNDILYKNFIARGKLANNWPGFEHTLGIDVTIGTVSINEKVYVIDIELDSITDSLLKISAYGENTFEMKDSILNMIGKQMQEKPPTVH